jgi:hypothetical protein
MRRQRLAPSLPDLRAQAHGSIRALPPRIVPDAEPESSRTPFTWAGGAAPTARRAPSRSTTTSCASREVANALPRPHPNGPLKPEFPQFARHWAAAAAMMPGTIIFDDQSPPARTSRPPFPKQLRLLQRRRPQCMVVELPPMKMSRWFRLEIASQEHYPNFMSFDASGRVNFVAFPRTVHTRSTPYPVAGTDYTADLGKCGLVGCCGRSISCAHLKLWCIDSPKRKLSIAQGGVPKE